MRIAFVTPALVPSATFLSLLRFLPLLPLVHFRYVLCPEAFSGSVAPPHKSAGMHVTNNARPGFRSHYLRYRYAQCSAVLVVVSDPAKSQTKS